MTHKCYNVFNIIKNQRVSYCGLWSDVTYDISKMVVYNPDVAETILELYQRTFVFSSMHGISILVIAFTFERTFL